ncbi:hypothetical protein LMG32289_05628 [Cupriavidus pampae]|uniref:Tyrosine specific protein phosphatases domain-containing protein n=1 Tax=Cupriavidus pampae TaxID=659251 RepID=A0ABM8XW58_9BURK|nr:hypothetical protein LMG32289_05628 [Cupriavidus pampae]
MLSTGRRSESRQHPMTALTVRYLPMHEACASAPRLDTAVISITNPGAAASLQPGWGAMLRVQFSDAEYVPGDIGRRMADGSRFDPATRGFPTQTQAQAIRHFCESVAVAPTLTRVLVHCNAGKRRSGAVACYLMERFGATLEGAVPEDPNRTVLALLRDPTWARRVAPSAGWRSRWAAARKWLRDV